MDTNQFYDSILPAVGLRASAIFRNGLKSAPVHSFYPTNQELVDDTARWDAKSVNVYHACASFKSDQSRKAENVAAVKSLWVDLDVGPTKPYKTKREAAEALEKFRVDVGLAKAWIVDSGGGVHAYFPFDKAIPLDKWQKLSATFAACLDWANVKHDSSRTTDAASVLRIPGTNNYKTDTPRAVVLKRSGDPEPVAAIYQKLKAYADANKILLLDKPKGKTTLTNDLIGTKDYPPSKAENIIQHCAVLRRIDVSGGDCSLDQWRGAMGVAKHLVDPDAVAQRWTANRAATDHDQTDYIEEMKSWKTPPTTCEYFATKAGCAECGSCKHFGKIGSPIHLGYDEEPVVSPMPDRRPRDYDLSFGSDFILARLQTMRVGRDSFGRMTINVQEDGTWKPVPFCDRYWQVLGRVRTLDFKWQLEIGYSEYNGHGYKTFLVDASAVMSPDMLRKEFSARELHIYGGQRAMTKTQEILRFETELFREQEVETSTQPTMGWTEDDKGDITGEFVLGSIKFDKTGAEQSVLLAPTVHYNFKAINQTVGTWGDWVAVVDRVYNRPGAEPYQFIIAAAFAAPLVRLTPGRGEWHGMPIALAGPTGAAKTSTAKVALSIYGPPDKLHFSAHSQQGDTVNAFAQKVGTLQNVPFLADEMTGLDPDKLASIMYMLANGKPRDRLRPDGSPIYNPYHWDVISFITGNENFHDKLKMLGNADAQAATQARCFEITLSAAGKELLFSNVPKNVIEDLLAGSHGGVGRRWLKFLVTKNEKVQEILHKSRLAYNAKWRVDSSLRFYQDLLCTVDTAARLAKKMALINWDVDVMMDWARKHMVDLQNGVGIRNWEDTASAFISSLHGKTIVTKNYKLGPGRRSKEMPFDSIALSAAPVARRAMDDRMFVVTDAYLRKWCRDNQVMPTDFLPKLFDNGYLILRDGLMEPKLLNIGSGSTVVTGQSLCWELNFDKAVDSETGAPGSVGNVVTFPGSQQGPVTDSVTAPTQDAAPSQANDA